MNRELAIKILKDMLGDYKDVNFRKDKEALEYAIKELERTAQEVPVQEQYIGKCNNCCKDNEITLPKHIGELPSFCMKCGQAINYTKTGYQAF